VTDDLTARERKTKPTFSSRVVRVPILASARCCGVTPGELCPWADNGRRALVRVDHWVCMLFKERLRKVASGPNRGWIERAEVCRESDDASGWV
jgi:hypothetical protein